MSIDYTKYPYGYDSINARAEENKRLLEESAREKELEEARFAKILKLVHEKMTSRKNTDVSISPEFFDDEIEYSPNDKYGSKRFAFDIETFIGPNVDRPKCKNCGKPLAMVDGGFDVCLDCRRRAKCAYGGY